MYYQSLMYDRKKYRKVYPPDMKAFLYFYASPGKPRIAGELRLRITSSDDAASFERGSDLLLSNGQPWSRPLFVLPRYYIPLYEKLREDGLVPDELDSVLSALPSKRFIYSRSQILYTLNDTFIVDFSQHTQFFSVITEQGMETLGFHTTFFDSRALVRHTPYTGTYTNHCFSNWWFWCIYRKCLGSIWTFNTSKACRNKDPRVTFSQDNHTCEVFYALLRWLCKVAKGRRTFPERC